MQFLAFIFTITALQTNESKTKKLSLIHDGRSLSLKEGEEAMYDEAHKLFTKFPAPIKFEVEKIEKLENESETESLKNGRISFAIFFVDEGSIKNALSANDDFFKIFISTCKDEAQRLNTPMPGIFAFSTKNKMIFRLKVENSYAAALKSAKLPLITVMNSENYKTYEETENDTFYFLVPKTEVEKVKKDFYEFVKQRRNELQVAIMEFDEERTNLKTLQLVKEDLPAMFVIKKKKKYVLKNIELENVKKFISDFYKNLLQPVILSGVEPADNDTKNVKVIVTNKAEKYFNDKSRDRLFVFQASWCRYCKLLSPIINKIGEAAADYRDKLIIGTMDLTENDIFDFEIKGFPTIYLMPANSDEKIIFDSSSRDFESISAFIEEKGTYKIKLEEIVIVEEEVVVEDEKAEKVIEPAMDESAKEL